MIGDRSGQRGLKGVLDDEPQRWLEVCLLPHISPLDARSGFASGRTVPEVLEGILFDPVAQNTTPRTTYALLDAAVCPLLPEMLESSDLLHKCLFTGKTMEHSSDVAPWLVELKPDHSFTRKLMSAKDTAGGLWEMELGIILKSHDGFDKIWSHCRKFTRIQDDRGRWLYYRFWSPPVSTRVMALGNRPELAQFVSPFFPPAERGIEVLLLNSDMHAVLRRLPGTAQPTAPPVLTPAAHNTIRQVRRVQQYDELINITLRHVTGKTSLSDTVIRDILRGKRDRFFAMGFWQRDHLAKVMVWEILLGPNFLDTYANGTAKTIIASANAPYEAIMNIEYFLQAQEICRLEAKNASQV